MKRVKNNIEKALKNGTRLKSSNDSSALKEAKDEIKNKKS